MTAPTELVQQQAVAVAEVRSRVLAALAALWESLGSWRGEDVDGFVAAALPTILAGEQLVSRLTEAYLTEAYATITGGLAHAIGLDTDMVSGAALRGGVDPGVVYRRPFVEVWTALSDGVSFDEAVQRGRTRLTQLAATDLQLAKTHTARAVMDRQEHVTGFRRVLNGAQSCGLCVVSATQRYHKQDLMPIHPGCDCGVQALVGSQDPGQIVNPQMLEQAHKAIRERFGASNRGAREIGSKTNAAGEPLLYRDVLLVHQHGEIGPVLGVKGQKFTGPGDLNG